MPAPYAAFRYTSPDKTSHNTIGWTSKVLFNYQYTGGQGVLDGDEIFTQINTSGVNYKGSYQLPEGYFNYPNVNSGRTLKISMNFLRPFDDNRVRIDTGLYDVNNDISYPVQPENVGYTQADSGNSLCKYECYLTHLYSSDHYLQVIGSVVFPRSAAGITVMTTMWNQVKLDYGINTPFRLFLGNRCESTISVVNLIVEEIG